MADLIICLATTDDMAVCHRRMMVVREIGKRRDIICNKNLMTNLVVCFAFDLNILGITIYFLYIAIALLLNSFIGFTNLNGMIFNLRITYFIFWNHFTVTNKTVLSIWIAPDSIYFSLDSTVASISFSRAINYIIHKIVIEVLVFVLAMGRFAFWSYNGIDLTL